ncbi:TetR/AcrR family transcriptional regulator [Kitasatospora cheerisanensis]|uniref:TetR family transcriptional regulator n=1 Tax=Kitasatospora cheerisanensis KCTC 2395 TaxID=1348663 RepID=A0A066YWM7_9ACTN|nr:TetR/AcrR family transcriptional regulator [Kitasatospora cheerisanensis]KDN82501.1 TetR family transcriptional regulator [Kitasatospora cheerisanensis KCTC 2395]
MTTVAAPRRRADATRNRARIVAAAREAFVDHGAMAPLDEIARRAGVGNATLYRNFADRRTLIQQVTLAVIERVMAHAHAATAEEPDSFAAVSRFVHAAADERIGALCSLLSGTTDPNDPELVDARAELKQVTEDLITRAQDDGLLRSDIGAGDVLVAVSQLTRPLPGTGCLDLDRFVHRHLQLLLDGLRTVAPSPLPGRAVTLEDLTHRV